MCVQYTARETPVSCGRTESARTTRTRSSTHTLTHGDVRSLSLHTPAVFRSVHAASTRRLDFCQRKKFASFFSSIASLVPPLVLDSTTIIMSLLPSETIQKYHDPLEAGRNRCRTLINVIGELVIFVCLLSFVFHLHLHVHLCSRSASHTLVHSLFSRGRLSLSTPKNQIQGQALC